MSTLDILNSIILNLYIHFIAINVSLCDKVII